VAVSREDIMRRAVEIFNESGVSEDLLALYAPDCVVVPMPQWPEDAEYHGRAGAAEALDRWRAAMPDFKVDLDEVVEVGEHLLGLGHFHIETGGGVERTGQELAQLADFRDGLISRQQFWLSWDEGRRAAGLTED
jgi:hypothetical protein